MSSPPLVTDFDAALKKDWKLVESKESVIDRVLTEIRPLRVFGRNDNDPTECGEHTILSALSHVFFDGKEDKDKLRQALTFSKDFNGDRKALDMLRDRMEETAQRLHNATDEKSKREIHRTHFAKAALAILSVKLHMKTDPTAAHKIYFERRDLAAEREIYAEHLCSSKVLPKEEWKKLEGELDTVSVWKLGKEMELEMKKISDKKQKDTIMFKVLEIIEKVSKDTEEKLAEGGDDKAAKMLLYLSGLVEKEDLAELKEPFQSLLETSQRIFDELQMTEGSQIQVLREDDTVFEMVMLATWWARYAALFFEFRQKVLKKDSESALTLKRKLNDCLGEGPSLIVFSDESIKHAKNLVDVLRPMEGKGKKRKARHDDSSDEGASESTEKKPRSGEPSSITIAFRPKKIN